MKKFLLSLMIPLLGIPAFAQEETVPNPLEFTAGGINYTILDVDQKTCQTKAGSSYLDMQQAKIIFNYGNDITGSVTIPATVQNPSESSNNTYTVVAIGSYSFAKASSVTIQPGGVTSIADNAFSGNGSLASVSIPDDVTSIGSYAFSGCTSLTSITLPPNITSIAKNTFASSGITTVNIPEGVVSIGESAFSSCSKLTSIEIPASVVSIGSNAFFGCSGITSLTLNEGITSIPTGAFQGCNRITEITIPASVTSIGEYGLYCSRLTQITALGTTPPAISYNSFNSANYSNATLLAYKTALNNYKKSSLWSNFSNIQMIQVPVTGIQVSPSTLNLNLGLSGQLAATITPAEANDEITWSVVSSVPEGAITVDENGKVTARKIGTGIVTANCGQYSATANVVVSANSYESVVIGQPDKDIFVGDNVNMWATVFPTTITPELQWSSSNTAVATIDATTGILTAVAPGGTVITATNNGVSGKLAITVYEVAPTAISLNQQTATLKAGQTVTLKATVSPENVTYPNVTWETSDPSVAIVSDGVVTAVGVGVANVRAMCGGFTANCTVTVEETPAEKITLNYTNTSIKLNQTLQLAATVTPETTTNKTVEWTSSDTGVATVSTEGVVTALSLGQTTITATCGNVSATCTLTVDPILSTDIVLNYSAATVKINRTLQLSATIYPAETTNRNVTWTSSDPTVATVENGLVTGLKEGATTITAANGNLTATCQITVEPVIAEQIILDQTTVTVNVGSNSTVSANVLPIDTTDATIVWESQQPEIASVANGMITGVSPGTTVITASCGQAVASCSVTVLQPATSISLNETSLSLQVGELFDLIETVMPANTTDIVTWESSNANVATVDANGIVTAIKSGTTNITASCGTVSATCEVSVTDVPASSVTISLTELVLKSGQSQQLSATVMPENTTNPTITWTSSDNNVATVAEDGTVTAVNAGTATITAACGTVSATCSVTVTAPDPEEVVLNYAMVNLKADDTVMLIVTHPADVNATDVTWTSSDSKVATVNPDGLVTALSTGETTITATYNGMSATCSIIVDPTEAEYIELDSSQIWLEIDDTIQIVAEVYPSTTTDPTITWISSNPEVATVDDYGFVTAVSLGNTTITAICGNVYASCNVSVVEDKSVSVEEINDNEAPGIYRIYTIQGINVMNTTDKSDLTKLNRGLYIINGKKVVIR